ncbi:hypothetical protein [Phascolarctobacterium succinatutens]|uniref:hypothetical protein n=1 Tax=Phascolarctobacterium succinatutens TaxID=626940 RepID=UPI003AF7F661
MQKKLFLGAALGLAMFASTAFSEVNTAYLANELRSYPGILRRNRCECQNAA